jgi:hypothetical protein
MSWLSELQVETRIYQDGILGKRKDLLGHHLKERKWPSVCKGA